jgi:hypothetical protein
MESMEHIQKNMESCWKVLTSYIWVATLVQRSLMAERMRAELQNMLDILRIFLRELLKIGRLQDFSETLEATNLSADLRSNDPWPPRV